MENNKIKALYRKYDLNDSDEELYDKKDMNQIGTYSNTDEDKDKKFTVIFD